MKAARAADHDRAAVQGLRPEAGGRAVVALAGGYLLETPL
jgi:hypothetical protein